MDMYQLQQAVKLLDERYPRVPPAGPIAGFVGPQLSTNEVARAYESHTESVLDPRLARSIRAFPVPALVGVTFTCPPTDFHACLDQALATALPGTTWNTDWLRRRGPGLVEKYGLLDDSYAARPDDATGQLMVLSLFGSALTPGKNWEPGDMWGGLVEIKITTAVWANVAGIGFGVPFYM